METEMTTQHKTLGEMLLSGDFAKSEETIIDGKHWQQVLDEAGYGLPDCDKKKTQPQKQQEITGGLLGNLTQQNPQTKQPIDSIFNALRVIAKNK
jgi:hypothetical protein